jgi:hypothetical protein
MSAKERRALSVVLRSVEQNSPRINKKLSKSRVRTSKALVYSAAKYYQALNKLASK